MADYSFLYSKEVTEQTLRELVAFIEWYNKLGHEPLIVGGWAAWAYHQGPGSKDIDVVFPGKAAMQQTLLQYFQVNGFKTRKTSLFDYEFYKTRKTNESREVEVIIDAVASDRRVVVDGTPIVIPWGLAEKFKRKHDFGNNVQAWIVSPELLLVYKIGALLGRGSQLRTSPEENRERIESKLWKDAQDVAGLLEKTAPDRKKLGSLLKQCNLMESNWLEKAWETAARYLDEPQKRATGKKWVELFQLDLPKQEI